MSRKGYLFVSISMRIIYSLKKIAILKKVSYTIEDQLGRIYLPTRHLFFGVGGVF